MRFRRRLSWTYWRRRWCIWRGHPEATWSPVVQSFREQDRWDPVLREFVPGTEYVQKSWRCALHDDPAKVWS